MINVFTYGTLMVEEVWFKVLKTKHKSKAGTLVGFERKKLSGKTYPGMVKNNNAKTEGVIYFDISIDELASLDDFEGEEYTREKVSVSSGDKTIECFAYIYKDEYKSNILPAEWNFEDFLKKGLNIFLLNYKGWKSHH
jgi:gamma-glutamylcyclotransferase (GGCT)/AIG2-like uncharacterized protein YtfP